MQQRVVIKARLLITADVAIDPQPPLVVLTHKQVHFAVAIKVGNERRGMPGVFDIELFSVNQNRNRPVERRFLTNLALVSQDKRQAHQARL